MSAADPGAPERMPVAEPEITSTCLTQLQIWDVCQLPILLLVVIVVVVVVLVVVLGCVSYSISTESNVSPLETHAHI